MQKNGPNKVTNLVWLSHLAAIISGVTFNWKNDLVHGSNLMYHSKE